MPELFRIVAFLFSPAVTVLVVTLALGLGVTLAIAPQLRNIRQSHVFFAIAWIWSAACIVKEIGVSDMRPRYAYPLVFLALGVVGILALATFRWVERNHHEALPSATKPNNEVSETLAELREVNDLICKKDENDLRSEFDFPDMLSWNIEFAKRNLAPNLVSADESSAIDAFFLNGQARLDLRYAKVTVINNRANVEWIPGKIGLINTSKKYVDSRRALSRLMSSAALPVEVTAALKMFDDTIEKDSALMIESLNASLTDDPRNILENGIYGADRYGSASGLYWKKFILLRPRADVVTLAVRKAMANKTGDAVPLTQP